MPLGTVCAQLVHAAGESGPAPPETYAVVLGVPNEYRLTLIEQQLAAAGIEHVTIREPDAPYLNAMTAIGICPTRDRERLRPITGKLRLVTEVKPCPRPASTTSPSSPASTPQPCATAPSPTSEGTST